VRLSRAISTDVTRTVVIAVAAQPDNSEQKIKIESHLRLNKYIGEFLWSACMIIWIAL